MVTATLASSIEAALERARDPAAYIADDKKAEIRICAGTACHASGRVALRTAVDKAIAERGLGGTDAVCARSVALFTRWLGFFAGSAALITGARGGVTIGGGIIPAWGARFDRSAFRAAFEAQPAQRAYVESIPTFLMLHPQPALVGLAAYARDQLSGSRAGLPRAKQLPKK